MRNKNLGVHTILIASALAMVAPFVWQIITSLKSLSNATKVPPSLLPEGRWDNYSKVFDVLPFGHQFLNTVLMAGLRTIGQVLFCSMAAYAFARLRFPGRNVLFGVLLSVLMVPPQLFIIPQYQIMVVARLAQLPAGVGGSRPVQRVRRLPAPAVLPRPAQGTRGGRCDRRRRTGPHLLVDRAAAGPSRPGRARRFWSCSGPGTTCSGRWWSTPIPTR